MIFQSYSFGSIRIDGQVYEKDLWIIKGKIIRRDKSIAKRKYGTSHTISRKELKQVITPDTQRLVVGAGQSGFVELTSKAERLLADRGIELLIMKTGELAEKRIELDAADAAIIHLTC